MCVMASANHLLMVFIGVEMASVPSYAMAGFMKGRRRAAKRPSNMSSMAAARSGIMLLRHQLAGGQVRHRLPADMTQALG